MEGFWANFGFFALLCVIVWGYKKVVERYENSCPCHRADENVYEAATLFSHNADPKNIIAVLMRCPDIDEAMADSIVKRAAPRKQEQDRRYRTFLCSVNREFGEALYSPHHRP